MSRARRRAVAPALSLLASALLLLAGCGPAGNAPPAPRSDSGRPAAAEKPSPAADAMIGKAKTPEERLALEKARDEVDAEMREKIRALDAELERLRKENEQLKKARPDAR